MNSKFKTLLNSYKNAWRVRRGAVIGYFIGAMAEVLGSLLVIYASAKLAGLLVEYLSTGQTSEIWFWFVVDVVGAVSSALGFWLMGFCGRLLYFSFAAWSIKNFVKKMSEIDIASFDDNETRTTINKVANGYAWTLSDLSSGALDLAYGVIKFLSITAVVSQISWWLLPLIVIFLMPSLIAESRIAKIQWFVFAEKGDERHIFWGLDWIIRQRSRQLELRAMQAKDYIAKKINDLNTKFYKTQEDRYKKANRYFVPAKISEAAGVAIGSFVLIKQFLDKTIALDQYLFLSGALLRVGGSLNNIFGTLSRMQEPLLFVQSYYEVLNLPSSNKDLPNAKNLPNKKSPPKIEFKNVNFRYPGSENLVFNRLNLTIRPAEHIAIVGENGAGKTTLIKLLLRFYKPESGEILIDGVDINDLRIDSLYDKIATLFQDFNQYPFSIGENITVGRVDRSQKHVTREKAAELSNVDKFVKKYQDGWDTVLDPSFKKGVEPSGGQWQRVALARAFYRDASILILDEPTASIDAKAEYEIFNNIFDQYSNKSAIIVSHRFSTVRRADRIVVIENGEIVEEGSHKKLMKNKNLYFDMFSKQAKGYL